MFCIVNLLLSELTMRLVLNNPLKYNKETIKNTVGKYYPTQANSARFIYAPQVQEVEFTEPSETGRYFEYLTLDVWLSIVSSYFNVKSTSKKNSTTPVQLVNFQLPGDNDLCLACKDSISVDPKVCQVKNVIGRVSQ